MKTRRMTENDFKNFLDNYEDEHKKRITKANIAEKLQMHPSTLSKIIHGHRDFRAGEIAELAEYLGISCDEIVYGCEKEHLYYRRQYGLSNNALKWLSQKNKSDHKLIDVINTIFQNHEIADFLFESFYFFANCKGIRIAQTDIIGQPVYSVFNDTKEMMWAVVSQYIKRVFEYVEQYYNENTIEPIKEEIIKDSLSALKNKYEDMMDKEKLTAEMDADLSDLESEFK